MHDGITDWTAHLDDTADHTPDLNFLPSCFLPCEKQKLSSLAVRGELGFLLQAVKCNPDTYVSIIRLLLPILSYEATAG